ncbi:hypothetical protein [Salinibacter altiplanensis]|uniref:hypothetical protein n=1 Tax=Salinibacter altiplanensis TaxID=1803181 RepID=UPI000C9F4DD9|nr:hypothetical protein [Salinibacter altiplanensis]
MNRSTYSTLASLFTAALVASTLLLGGCSDSVTGPQQADEDVTVQQQAEHNSMGDGDTDPRAGHNTTDED